MLVETLVPIEPVDVFFYLLTLLSVLVRQRLGFDVVLGLDSILRIARCLVVLLLLFFFYLHFRLVIYVNVLEALQYVVGFDKLLEFLIHCDAYLSNLALGSVVCFAVVENPKKIKPPGLQIHVIYPVLNPWVAIRLQLVLKRQSGIKLAYFDCAEIHRIFHHVKIIWNGQFNRVHGSVEDVRLLRLPYCVENVWGHIYPVISFLVKVLGDLWGVKKDFRNFWPLFGKYFEFFVA